MKKSAIHAGHVRYALANHFDWFANKMMPEWSIGGGLADLVFVSKAGYVTEIEIKTSRSDWNADQHKAKWSRSREYISRFFYAVPMEMTEKIPEWVAPEVGIIGITVGEYGIPKAREIRAAKRLKGKKLSDGQKRHMFERCYYRFWHAELSRLRASLYDSHSKKQRISAM